MFHWQKKEKLGIKHRIIYNIARVFQQLNRSLTGVRALQTYGMGGESLRSLTEKLHAVSHTLQMGIQGRWRLNSYNGRSTTKLPAGVLQLVVELITSAKGLFSLLNRLVKRVLSNRYICSPRSYILFCSSTQKICSAVSSKNSSCRFCYRRLYLKKDGRLLDMYPSDVLVYPLILNLSLIHFSASVQLHHRADQVLSVYIWTYT